MLLSVDELERGLLERGTSWRQSEFDAELKNTIINTLRDEYVRTGIISDDKFKIETDKWINEI